MKKQRIVKWQHVRDVETTKTYWDWREGRTQLPVPNEAEPDQVAAPNDDKEKSDELVAVLVALDRGAEKVLTKVERRAFQLVVRENKSLRDAALRMKCSFQSVDEAVKRAAVKIRKLSLTNMS